MPYSTTEMLTNPTFVTAITPWIIKVGSGWTFLDPNVQHVSVGPDDDADNSFAGPSLYQEDTDMVEGGTLSLENGKTYTIGIVVESMGGTTPKLHVHLVELVNMEDGGYGASFNIIPAITSAGSYSGEFTVPLDKDWCIAVFGNHGGLGATSVVSSMSLKKSYPAIACAMSSVATDETAVSPIPVTVTFGESVTGFEVGDIVVTNGSAGNFAGSGTTYTFDLTPDSGDPKVVKADIAAGVATNAKSIPNAAAAQFSRTYYLTGTSAAKRFSAQDQTEA